MTSFGTVFATETHLSYKVLWSDTQPQYQLPHSFFHLKRVAQNTHIRSVYSPMTTLLHPALGRMLIWADSFGRREPSPLISSAV